MAISLLTKKRDTKEKPLANPPTIYKYPHPSPKSGRVCNFTEKSTTIRNQSGIDVDTLLISMQDRRVGQFGVCLFCRRFFKNARALNK